MKRAACGVLLLACCHASQALGQASPDDVYVRTATDGNSWTIGNRLIERSIVYSATRGLLTDSWRYKVTGKNFLAGQESVPPAAEFSFQIDGHKLRGAVDQNSDGSFPAPDFRFIEVLQPHATAAEAKVLEFRLQARKLPLAVSVFYEVYANHPVVRKWLSITNLSHRRITLSNLVFEDVSIRAAPQSEQLLFAHYGTLPRENFLTGRVDDTAIVAIDPRSRQGYLAMNEAPGWLKRTETPEWRAGLRIMYDTDIFPFERTLEPGETFVSAKSGILFFQEGNGFADPRWSMPLYCAEVLMRQGRNYRPRWLYNNWEPFLQDYDAAIVNDSIPIAGRMGFDVFTLDTGWSDTYADAYPDPSKFPHGLNALKSSIEKNGMRLGMWSPLAVVSKNSADYRKHPEWVVQDLSGKKKTTGFPGKGFVVMCLGSAYRESAARRINQLIQRYHLDYVKLDLTTVFNAYGEAPGCSRRGHYHRTWAESLTRIYEGIQYVTDAVHRQHPAVVVDLTFEAWGQKHLIDYGLLAAGDIDWMSNVNDSNTQSAGPRQARILLYQRSLAIPAEAMVIGNLQAPTLTLEEHFATAIAGTPVLLGDLRKMTTEQIDWYREKILWLKAFRKTVPLFESFFPLGHWQQPTVNTWDGFARLSRKGEGVIALFKNDSEKNSISFVLPTYPEGHFLVRSVITGSELGRFTADDFRHGIEINFPSRYKAEVLEVRMR